MSYRKLPELKSLSDRELVELKIQVLERTRKNTGAIADMIGTLILLSIVAGILSAIL